MSISIEAIIGVLGLFIGGGGGAFYMWRWQSKKAKAEAEKEEQSYYQTMIDDIARDRDYYKQERDEFRRTIKGYDERIDQLERAVARNGRMVEAMRPFMYADLTCKNRKRVIVSESGEVSEKKPRRKEVKDEGEFDIAPGH